MDSSGGVEAPLFVTVYVTFRVCPWKTCPALASVLIAVTCKSGAGASVMGNGTDAILSASSSYWGTLPRPRLRIASEARS